MSQKEIYRLGIKITVDGDEETKEKLSAIEKIAQRTKKKLKALEKITVNPSIKVKDSASVTIDKVKSKTSKLGTSTTTAKIKARDEASKIIDFVSYKTDKLNNKKAKVKTEAESKAKKVLEDTESVADKLNNKKAKVKIDAEDKASKVVEKAQYKTGKFSQTTATAKIDAEDKATKTINKIKGKINSFVKTGAKKIISVGIAGSLALGGIGLGSSIKTFAEYEKGLSNVKAVTGATDNQMKQLDSTAKQLGSTTAWSARNVTQAEELLGQAGFNVEETISALPGLLDLASAGDLDLAAATDIASGTLRSFNLNANESAHVADVLALSASATNSDVTDLGETMKYVAPVSQALGISLEDTAAAAGLLSNANIKGSQAGTVLRQAMARLASPTGEASKMMKKYGINAFDAKGNMKPLSGVVDNLNSSLGKLTSQQRADVISTIFGTESMSGVLALMNQGGKSLSSLSKELKNANGAAHDMADTKLDNLYGQWIILKSAVEHMQVSLGERLAPYAKQFVTWLTGKIPAITDSIVSFVDYLSKNTETIKSVAIAIAGIGLAFAGFSAVGKIGSTISGIKEIAGIFKGAKTATEAATVAGGIKKIGILGKALPLIFSPAGLAISGAIALAGTAIVTNNNLMKKSLSTTTEELGPLEKVLNKLNGSVYKSKKEMQKLGLIYEDFGSGVSDEFKDMVDASTKKIREFQFFLNEINLDGVINKAESSKFDSKVEEMVNSAIKTIEGNKSKGLEGMKAMFMDDGTLSDAEKATLEYITRNYNNQINAENDLKNKILEIKKKAIDGKRELNAQELKDIKKHQSEIEQIMLESAGGTSEEILYSKNKFKARAEGVNLEDASTLAKESFKERDNRVVEVEAKYNTYLDRLKNDLTKATDQKEKDNIKSTIEQNTKAKENKIAQILKLSDDNLKTLYTLNGNLEGKLNKYDGTILSSGDKRAQSSLDEMKERYSDMNNVKETGYYGIRNSKGDINSMYITVDKNTKEITGAWNATTKEVGAYTAEIKSNVKKLGDAYTNVLSGAIKYLGDKDTKAHYSFSSKQIVDKYDNSIGKLGEMKEAANGTLNGILDLNGTPIHVTTDANGAIIRLSEVRNALDEIPGTTEAEIKTNADQATSAINKTGNAIINLPNGKTINVKTVFENVVKNFASPITNAAKRVLGIGQKATGTTFASGGLSTVNERGWELSDNKSVPVLGSHKGNPLTYLSPGTKILNHMQSIQDMKKAVAKEVDSKIVKQPRQMQYQLIQAPPQQQVQVASAGGMNFGDFNININGVNDIDEIIVQATQEFARKLKESFSNIKK